MRAGKRVARVNDQLIDTPQSDWEQSRNIIRSPEVRDQLRQLFKVIRSKRDKAIFLVAYRHGLWASEIGLLQRADVDVKQGRVRIHRLKGSISGMYPMQPDVV